MSYFSLKARRPILICLLLSLPMVATAQVYTWTDENGKVHYSDKKPSDKNVDVKQLEKSDLENPNVLDSSADTVDANDLSRDRKRRESERDVAEQKRLQQQAQAFQSKYCVTAVEEIRQGKAGGGTRVVGTRETKKCSRQIPSALSPFLSDYRYQGN